MTVLRSVIFCLLAVGAYSVEVGDKVKKDPVSYGFQAGNANGEVCPYQGTCAVDYVEGVCVSVSSGCCTGKVTSGLCPGSSDIKCCTNNGCSTPNGSGTCLQTSLCTGTSYPGYCTGPGDLQCCVGGTPPVPPTPTTAEYGVDVSTDMSAESASCLATSGNTYVIPRGYCSDGTIDHRVCSTLTTAYNAGIKTRDTYLFPCELLSKICIPVKHLISIHVFLLGPTCSISADEQMKTLLNHLNTNCKEAWSGRVWLDIEGTQYWTGNTDNNRVWYQVS